MVLWHQFIFQPGVWIGEGKIVFSSSPEHIRFFMKWTVQSMEEETIASIQQIEMHGMTDSLFNNFRFSNVKEKSFDVELENEALGFVQGKGVIDQKAIAWEFRGHPKFEGFEIYELQDNGDYMLHAEYVSPEGHRTTIEGRIWKKMS